MLSHDSRQAGRFGVLASLDLGTYMRMFEMLAVD